MAKLKGKEKAAFLRRMARGRNKKAGGVKRKHSEPTKRKRRHHHKKGGHMKRNGKGRRRHHSGGGMGRFVPATGELIGIATAFAYGKLEEQADKDKGHMLNNVPVLLPNLGRAGNAAIIAWGLGVVLRKQIIKDIARGALSVAAYQQARGKGFAEGQQNFVMGGAPSPNRSAVLLENYLQKSR